jgi:tight adherence protein B
MGFVLGLCFAAGIGLIWLGAVSDVRLPTGAGRVRAFLASGGVELSPAAFISGTIVVATLGGVLVNAATGVPALATAAGCGAGWAPVAWVRGRREGRRRERERAWPAARLRADGLQAALEHLGRSGEHTVDTVALLLRAGLLDLPAGGLAAALRELAGVLSERLEAREKARSRAHSLQVEAGILALSPIVLLLLVGVASPAYLDAYKTPAGTAVGVLGGVLILGCYILMRRLGRIPEPRRTGGKR